MGVVAWYIIAFMVFPCNAVTFEEQLKHIARRRQESRGIYDPIPLRRFDDKQMSVILGAPSIPSHLPEAEPILPGHTLLRPARGMLKSAVKFPHRDLDNGAGVYGNIKNLGIKYDGRSDRVRYSGFRRMLNNLGVEVRKARPIIPPSSVLSFFQTPDRSEEFEIKPLRQHLNGEWPEPQPLHGIIINVRPSKQGDGEKKEKTDTEDQINSKITKKIIKPKSNRKPMLKKVDIVQPQQKRFGPPGQKTWKKKHLRELDSILRDGKVEEHNYENNIIILQSDESSEEDKETSHEDENEKIESKEDQDKLKWFWNSQDTFNNIKISPEAPELAEFMPKGEKEKIRQWWFYHQEDFKPFKD